MSAGNKDTIEQITGEGVSVVKLQSRSDFFSDEAVKSIEARAFTYAKAAVPIHFRGPAGTGKTTLAMQIAAKIGRPVVLMTGDGWHTSHNLIGKEAGTRQNQVVDNFIHSVKKVRTETHAVWADNVLTYAVSKGYTLVYDEFTRSPPSANNPLLMALEERMLLVASRSREENVVRAHPEFRAIFTSNPDDYAGVSSPQDALLDRMITFDLEGFAVETEAGIVSMRAGVSKDVAKRIVKIVRGLGARDAEDAHISLRPCIMIAQVVRNAKLSPSASDQAFNQLCADVLQLRAPESRDVKAWVADRVAEIAPEPKKAVAQPAVQGTQTRKGAAASKGSPAPAEASVKSPEAPHAASSNQAATAPIKLKSKVA